MARIASLALCCILQAWLVLGAVYTPSGGPVYVNPAAAPPAAPSANTEQFVTQTVYGFLDFTTTIGNTVMVFSPQSAPAAEAPKPPSAPASVIETKPPPTASAAPEIKPSKTSGAKSSDKKAAPSVSPAPPPKKPQAEAKPSPAPAPAPSPPAPVAIVSSVVEVRGGPAPPPAPPSSVVEVRGPTSVVASKVEVREGTTKVEVHPAAPAPPVVSSVVEVRASGGDENNVDDPEYDFLSRQPAQIVDETYKVINLKPSSKFHKNRASAEAARPKAGNSAAPAARPRPTPTAQGPRILKTAAPSLAHKRPAPALDPTPAGSLHEETVALPLEQLFASQPTLQRASRRPAPAPAFSSRFHRNRAQDEDAEPATRKPTPAPAPAPARSARPQPAQTLRPSARKNGFSKHFGRTPSATPELATVSVYSGETASRRFGQQSASGNRRSGFRPAATADARPQPTPTADAAAAAPSSRRYKTRTPQPSAPDAAGASTSLYKFKLSRPAGRWSYKTTPKPRVSIRRQDEEGGPTPPPPVAPAAASAQSPPQPQAAPLPDDAENEPAARLEPEQIPSESATAPGSPESGEKPVPAAETIKVEISTPADFSDVYYELATIKSPYTFQVGTVKNTRYITVTSTFAKTLAIEPTSAAAGAGGASATVAPGEEPLTENLLASTLTPHYDRREPIDSSIATLPPIALAGDASTPPLETLTETFSTTQLLLKTHILPVIREGTNTTRYTLVQSYHVTRLVTALKTLPPMEVYHFVPSKTLTDLNTRLEEAGSELHLELDFGEDEEKDAEDRPLAALRALAPDLDLANVGSDFDLADVDRARLPELQQHLRLKKAQKPDGAPQNQLNGQAPQQQQQPQFSPEQLQQLALLRFLNPAAAAALPQVITTSRPVVKVETLYESHVIPVFNGQQTSYSTISRPVATVSKTDFEVATTTLPLPPVVPPVVPQNPLFPNQQQQQFAITSSPLVTQTVVTATDSKVLKLTFGAKTAYTTLYSTRLVPTMLTTYLTGSVPVQPTAPAFGGFFPPAYPQFPFVG